MNIILAFSAGLLSFLSPCVLPLLPAYLSYIAGSAINADKGRSKAQLLLRSVFFVAGFSLIFILLGVTVSAVSKLLAANLLLFKRLGGVLVFVFGLHMTGLLKIKPLYSEKKLLPEAFTQKAGPFLLGMAFAAGWTPCVGPILSSILILAGSMATVGSGVLLLVFYALGLAVPFLLSAFFIGSITGALRRFSKFLPVISVISGVLLMLMGILLFTDQLAFISRYFSFFTT